MASSNLQMNYVESVEVMASSEKESSFDACHLVTEPARAQTERRATVEAVPNGKNRRNQVMYYYPGTVCSRFGMRLRELRRERNLTQDRMAVDFGIDRSFISDVERGRKSISLPLLEVIALGMNMSLSDLFKDL